MPAGTWTKTTGKSYTNGAGWESRRVRTAVSSLPQRTGHADPGLRGGGGAGLLRGDERVEHVDGTDPLQSHTTGGVTSVYAPENAPWAVTFGSYLLCSASVGEITLDGVRYHAPVKPKSVSLNLQTVTPRMWQQSIDAGQIGAALGEPHHFRKRKAPGRYENPRAGNRITQSRAGQDKEGAPPEQTGGAHRLSCHARVTNTVDALGPQGPHLRKPHRPGPCGRQKTVPPTCTMWFRRRRPRRPEPGHGRPLERYRQPFPSFRCLRPRSGPYTDQRSPYSTHSHHCSRSAPL
ncbi:hypothetical protein GCM10010341_34430 [Streptomyces noursei]|nr:hypothetical protein GCM10010341_34430 [Streptomyces noursei]